MSPGALAPALTADRRRRRQRRICLRRRRRVRQRRFNGARRRGRDESVRRGGNLNSAICESPIPICNLQSTICNLYEALRRARWTRSSSTSTTTAACSSKDEEWSRRRRSRSGARSFTPRAGACRADRTARRPGTDGPGFLTVRPFRYFVVTTLLFAALTAVMTYPQVLHLNDGVHDDGDPLMRRLGPRLGRASAADRAGASSSTPTSSIPSVEHARVLRDAAGAGRWSSRRCTGSAFGPIAHLQPRVPVRLRRCRASGVALLVRPLTGNTVAPDLSPGSSSRSCRTASITTRTCSCSRRSSAARVLGVSPAARTAAACATACCSACSPPARCCRACTTGSSWCRTWQSCAARC